MRLYEDFPDRITVGSVECRLTLYFDRVLHFLELLQEDDPDAIEVGYSWLVRFPKNPPYAVKSEVVQRIFSEIVHPPKKQLHSKKKTARPLDFGIDAAEIYSSFMRDYGIDLIQERGRMHWCRFIALFEGLSDDTPIKQIMRIRTQELPRPNKHNAEQIQRLMELKTLYALPEKQTAQEQTDTWGGLFDMLLKKAEERPRREVN